MSHTRASGKDSREGQLIEQTVSGEQENTDSKGGNLLSAGDMSAHPGNDTSVSMPFFVWLVLGQLLLELVCLVPFLGYKLILWTPYVGEPQLSPYIFSWLSLVGFIYVVFRILKGVRHRAASGFAYCMFFLMLHVAAAGVGAGTALLFHVVYGASPIFYQGMAAMCALAVAYFYWLNKFKKSLSVRVFFHQPPFSSENG